VLRQTYIFLRCEYNHITAYTRTPQSIILRHHHRNTPRHTRTYVSPYYAQDINRTSAFNRINHTPHSPRLSQSSITYIKQYTFHVDTYRCILQHIIRILKIYFTANHTSNNLLFSNRKRDPTNAHNRNILHTSIQNN
jgi:hypothetical protein